MGDIDLGLETTTQGDWTVLQVKGEVDLYTSPQLRERLTELTETIERILVDLTSVDFMDSSGLGVLVASLKRARERGGDLALVCQEGSALKVITITGLDKVFAIFDSVAAAAES